MGSINHRKLLVLILAAALSIGFQARPALAVHTNGEFELDDGNSVEDTPPADDFNTIYSGPGSSVFTFFAHDEVTPDVTIHTGGDKEDGPVSSWGCTKSGVGFNAKVDIRHAYAATYSINGSVYVFFGANRDSNNGDATLGFWLLQDKVGCTTPTSAPFLGAFSGSHRDGDLFIQAPFTGGGGTIEVEVWRWNDPTPNLPEDGDESMTLLISGDLNCQANHDPTDPDVCGTGNAVTINTAWESGDVEFNKYIEGGINLTSIFARFFTKDVCYVGYKATTRASQDMSADLDDFTVGELRTCGSITVNKVTDPAGSSQMFDFVTAGGPDAISDPFQLTDGDSNETASVRPGTYAVTETVPAGWVVSATCSDGPFGAGAAYVNGEPIVMGPGQSATCTFTNSKLGSITVDKVTVPAGSSQPFQFTVTGPSGTDISLLTDAGAPHTTANLMPGSYTVTEAVVADWTLSATCVGGPFGNGSAYTNGAPFNLAGEAVSCTFTNTETGSGGGGGGGPGPAVNSTVERLSKGIVHEIGMGPKRSGMAMSGIFSFPGALKMAKGAKLTITSLLREDGGQELVTGLPVNLPIKSYAKNGSVGIFRSSKGVFPLSNVTIGAMSGGRYTFEMQISKATIAVPSGCPSPTLTMGFTIDDGVNPPVVFSVPVAWRCHGLGWKYMDLQ